MSCRSLVPALLGLLALLLCAPTASAATKTFHLPTGSPAKLKTGIVLHRNEKVKLRVSGNGKCGEGDDCPAGNPLGSGQTCASRPLGPLDPGPAPSLPFGSVAAQIGTGAPFATGAARTATGKGELVIFYNDCADYYGDNTGSFTVKATYSPSCRVNGNDEGDRWQGERVSARLARAADGSTKCRVTLSGTVRRHVCHDVLQLGLCMVREVKPAPERPIILTSGRKTFETETTRNGTWSVKVPTGRHYTVRAAGDSFPRARNVAAKRDVGDIDFTYCKLPDGYPAKVGCDLVKVNVTMVDSAGAAYSLDGMDVDGPGDGSGGPVDGQSVTLYLPRGRQQIEAQQIVWEGHVPDHGVRGLPPEYRSSIPEPLQIAKGTFNLDKDVNSVTLVAKPAFAPFIGEDERKELLVILSGLPSGLEPSLTYQLRGTQADATCRFNQTGTIPLEANGHSAVVHIHPQSQIFCTERYSLQVYSGATVVAETSLRIT